jgi:hypothetical protein
MAHYSPSRTSIHQSSSTNFHTVPTSPSGLLNKTSPTYRREGSTVGYTGYYPCQELPPDEIEQPCEKYMIRGATGKT